MERLRVRGGVRFAPGTALVKRGESLLLEVRREIPKAQARRVQAVGFENREHRPRRVKRDERVAAPTLEHLARLRVPHRQELSVRREVRLIRALETLRCWRLLEVELGAGQDDQAAIARERVR